MAVASSSSSRAVIHPKRVAGAFDVTAATMLRYYTATEKKRTADEVLGELQEELMLRKAEGQAITSKPA
jgi:hypothetical protein